MLDSREHEKLDNPAIPSSVGLQSDTYPKFSIGIGNLALSTGCIGANNDVAS
jgi:hypothetical protein